MYYYVCGSELQSRITSLHVSVFNRWKSPICIWVCVCVLMAPEVLDHTLKNSTVWIVETVIIQKPIRFIHCHCSMPSNPRCELCMWNQIMVQASATAATHVIHSLRRRPTDTICILIITKFIYNTPPIKLSRISYARSYARSFFGMKVWISWTEWRFNVGLRALSIWAGGGSASNKRPLGKVVHGRVNMFNVSTWCIGVWNWPQNVVEL